jgi:hypothetical protein
MIHGVQVRKISTKPLDAIYEVASTAPYTRFQNDGTAAHGPVRARFMVFTPKGGGGLVFAKWVRGVTGAHFMEKAVDKVSLPDFLHG